MKKLFLKSMDYHPCSTYSTSEATIKLKCDGNKTDQPDRIFKYLFSIISILAIFLSFSPQYVFAAPNEIPTLETEILALFPRATRPPELDKEKKYGPYSN